MPNSGQNREEANPPKKISAPAYNSFKALADQLSGLPPAYLIMGILGMAITLVLLTQALWGKPLNTFALAIFAGISCFSIILAILELFQNRRNVDISGALDIDEAKELHDFLLDLHARETTGKSRKLVSRLIRVLAKLSEKRDSPPPPLPKPPSAVG